jgi:hypothetical protein
VDGVKQSGGSESDFNSQSFLVGVEVGI